MSIQVFGMAVSRGVAIGKAVLIASSRVDVAHYFVLPSQVESEIERLREARNAVAAELSTLQRDLPQEAPAELSALLDVHLMLLHDEALTGSTKQWISERHYNAEWALSAQLEVLARQFDEMEDEYLRERKGRHRAGRRATAAGTEQPGGRRPRRRAPPVALRMTSPARIPWCSWPTMWRPPTCFSSSEAFSRPS
jgi:signal transduction protein with GAF and PtsI domain